MTTSRGCGFLCYNKTFKSDKKPVPVKVIKLLDEKRVLLSIDGKEDINLNLFKKGKSPEQTHQIDFFLIWILQFHQSCNRFLLSDSLFGSFFALISDQEPSYLNLKILQHLVF